MVISNDAEPLARELERVVGDLRRSLEVSRAVGPAEESLADAAHRLAQLLADAAADARQEPRRGVPRLADRAVADQVAVTGQELLAALAAGGREVRLDDVFEAVAALRRQLRQ